MMSYVFITDRMQSDVIYARELVAKVQRGEQLTESEQTEYFAGLKGCYNIMDINRVETAAYNIVQLLRHKGYSIDIDWTDKKISDDGSIYIDHPFDVIFSNEDVWLYVNRIKAIRTAFADIGHNIYEILDIYTSINYDQANALEIVLQEIYRDSPNNYGSLKKYSYSELQKHTNKQLRTEVI